MTFGKPPLSIQVGGASQSPPTGASRVRELPVCARLPRRAASTSHLPDERRALDAQCSLEAHAVDAGRGPRRSAAAQVHPADAAQLTPLTPSKQKTLHRRFSFSRKGRTDSAVFLESQRDLYASHAIQKANSPKCCSERQSLLSQDFSRDVPSCNDAPSHNDAPFYKARGDLVLEAYRPALSSHDVGKDALSAHNKYHFCVRWYRLHGRTLSPSELQCVHASCAAYLDPIVRGFADNTLTSLSPDMSRWSASELALAAKFMSKHEVGKDKGADGADDRSPIWKGRDDLCFRFMFTLGYWLQKLADHDLLRYKAYEGFTSWGISVCRHFFRECPGMGLHVLAALSGQMEHMLLSQPVRVINTIYTMQRLGVCPCDFAVLDTWRIFQAAWGPLLKRSPQRYKDYLYGLTHFLLNETSFYQYPVSIEAHVEDLAAVLSWILDYFNEHVSEILALGDPDLLGEIVLCYLFSGRSLKRDWESCSRCIKVVGQCFNTDPELLGPQGLPVSYVFRKGRGPGDRARGLRVEEHTNAVCLLALGFWVRRASSRLIHLYSQSGPVFGHGQWTELLGKLRAP